MATKNKKKDKKLKSKKKKLKKVPEPWETGTALLMENGETVLTGQLGEFGKKMFNTIATPESGLTMKKLLSMKGKKILKLLS